MHEKVDREASVELILTQKTVLGGRKVSERHWEPSLGRSWGRVLGREWSGCGCTVCGALFCACSQTGRAAGGRQQASA